MTKEHFILHKETNLVKIICQNPLNRGRFESMSFPFHGAMNRQEMIDMLSCKEEIETEARPQLTNNFLIKEDGILYINNSTVSSDELIKINSQIK